MQGQAGASIEVGAMALPRPKGKLIRTRKNKQAYSLQKDQDKGPSSVFHPLCSGIQLRLRHVNSPQGEAQGKPCMQAHRAGKQPTPGLPVRSTAGTGRFPPPPPSIPPLKRGLWNIFFSSQNRTFVLYLRSKPEGRRGTLTIEIASQKRLGMTRTHKRDRLTKETRNDENTRERSLRKRGSR